MPYEVLIDGQVHRITKNLDPIFKKALGKSLMSLNNMSGIEAYHVLWPAVATIFHPGDRDAFEELNPKNGNGTYYKAREFLVNLLIECSDEPQSIISVKEINYVQS